MGASHSSSLLKRFNSEQLVALKKFYKDIASRNNKEYLDRNMFLRLFKLPGILGERLFDIFDSKRDMKVDLTEFLEGLTVMIHGSNEEKTKFLFDMYDLNGDGVVSYAELTTMLYCAVYGGRIFSNDLREYDTELNEDERLKEEEKEFRRYVKKLTNEAFLINDKHINEPLNFEDFSLFIQKKIYLLQILEDAFIFEDFSDEEIREPEIESHEGHKRIKIRGISGKENDLHFNIQKTFKRFLNSNCSQGFCFLGDIITPDSVKDRHKIAFKTHASLLYSQNNEQCSLHPKNGEISSIISFPEDMTDEVTLNITHAFEHMHHFHHDANHSGHMFKVGKSLKMLVQRYLVLHDSFLYVFRKFESITPLRTIWMKGCVVRIVNHESSSKRRTWGIEISFPCDSTGSYTKHFYAQNEKTRDRWVEALKVASDSKDFLSLYSLTAEIGNGKFSKVFSCVNKETRKEYAVKVINKSKMNEQEKEALRLEISIMQLVHHPNIIQIRNVFEDKETVYILMQLFRGGDLFDRIKKNKNYDEAKAKAIMWRLFDVCKYIHSLGIAHRDLKPENIMLRDEENDERIAVGDFGLSCFIGPESLSKMPCGTLSYVAPEVFLGRGYGKEVDVWSLGVIMYVLLRGVLPFGSKHKNEHFNKVIDCKLNFSQREWDKITPEAKDLISRLLNVDPMQRIKVKDAVNHSWFTEATVCVENQ